MLLEIIKYGHPVLREKGKRITQVTPEIRRLAEDMMETMRANSGVGLAAQQVGQPLQLAVLDVRLADRPSAIFVNGEERSIADFMPMTLINPVLHKLGEAEEVGVEGCLCFPDINAEIKRAARILVDGLSLDWQPLRFECTGLLARVVQHEVDHLNGILFVDRMDTAVRASLSGKLKRLQKETRATYRRGATAAAVV